MTTSEKVFKNKLGLLELSQQLGNTDSSAKVVPFHALRCYYLADTITESPNCDRIMTCVTRRKIRRNGC